MVTSPVITLPFTYTIWPLEMSVAIFVEFVEDNATMSSLRYFENHVTYFVQIRRK